MAAFSTTLKTSWLLCLGLVILALLAPKQADAHMAMLYPTPRGGYGTKQFDGRIHVFIDYKGFKFPCGGYPKGPTTSTLLWLSSFAFLFLFFSGTRQEMNLFTPTHPWIINLTNYFFKPAPLLFFEQA
jgi:hypothetical protein